MTTQTPSSADAGEVKPPNRAAELIATNLRYIEEIEEAMRNQIPLNADQLLFEERIDPGLKEVLRLKINCLIKQVCRRQAGRLRGIALSLQEAARNIPG